MNIRTKVKIVEVGLMRGEFGAEFECDGKTLMLTGLTQHEVRTLGAELYQDLEIEIRSAEPAILKL